MGQQPQTTTVSDIYGVGVANLNFNGNWLGATQGGVTVEITHEQYEQVIDAYGSTPIGVYEQAVNIIVTAPLKEETIAKLLRVLQFGTNATTKITFGRYVGRAQTGYRLIVLPYDDAAHDIIIYKAVPQINWSLTYSNDGERVYEVKFKGLIDASRSDNDKLFRLDESYSI
jgi:hypothetical protein